MVASLRGLVLCAAAGGALYAAPALAGKARFVFTPLVPPGNTGEVYVTGVYQDQAVGDYTAANGVPSGFAWSAGNYTGIPAVYKFNALSDSGVAVGGTAGSYTSFTTYDLTTGATHAVSFGPPGSPSFLVGGINASGAVVATQLSKDGRKTACQPFEQETDGSYAWLANAQVGGFVPFGVTDANVVLMDRLCGYHRSGNYYLFKNGKQKKFTISGGAEVEINFVNGAGFGGSFLNTSGEIVGFTSTGMNLKLTTFSIPPNDMDIEVLAIGPHHEVAGYLLDPYGYFHGFIYTHKNYYTIDYPKQKSTLITGFSSTGAIVGYFGNLDYNHGLPSQPFVATCASDRGCTK